MAQCNGFRAIYKRQRQEEVTTEENPPLRDEKGLMNHDEEKDDEDTDRNPCHFKVLDRIISTIFEGKVVLETGRKRKLTARVIMTVAKSDEKVADVWVPDWSHQEITFSRADIWAKLPQPGRFPLVLDPVIDNIRFQKVLIDDGSALDILFHNTLLELGLTQKDLEPYDAPF